MTLALPASMASAIVSPRARPNPRMIAPKIPVAAVGTKIARIASQRVAPMPKAASRSFGGTATSASREIAEMVGSTMIASTIEAGSKPGPLRPVPNNRNPSQMRVQPVSGRTDERNHDENAPQPVNHAGDRGQQLDGDFQHILDPVGQRAQPRILRQPQEAEHGIKSGGQKTLAEKNRDSQTEDRADSQSEYRTIQRPDDRRQNSELRAIGVPGGSAQKTQAVAANRRHRLPADAENQPEDQKRP